LHAENIFVGFVVPENKIFYAALLLMRINNINLRTGWAEFKPPHPGDRQVRKFPREGMSFVIKPPILSRPPPPTGFTLIGALL
jgi:hypothetical protein